MERRPKKEIGSSDQSKSSGSDNTSTSIFDTIRKLAEHNARAPLDTEELQLLFLQSWWSRTYNRPLKDPILLTYTLEDLLYEFYDRIERTKASEEAVESEDDRIEEDKEKAVLDWAEQEEKRELEALKDEAAELELKKVEDPTKDPENVKWMEEQIKKDQDEFGTDFGTDLDLEF